MNHSDDSVPVDSDLAGPMAAAVKAVKARDLNALSTLLSAHPEFARLRSADSRTLLHHAADWPGNLPNGSAVVTASLAMPVYPSRLRLALGGVQVTFFDGRQDVSDFTHRRALPVAAAFLSRLAASDFDQNPPHCFRGGSEEVTTAVRVLCHFDGFCSSTRRRKSCASSISTVASVPATESATTPRTWKVSSAAATRLRPASKRMAPPAEAMRRILIEIARCKAAHDPIGLRLKVLERLIEPAAAVICQAGVTPVELFVQGIRAWEPGIKGSARS
jgi:hypothetical protein